MNAPARLGGYAALAGMRLAAAVVPRVRRRVLFELADVAGAASYCLAAPARRGIAANLARVLDPEDPDLVALRAREAFRTQARNYVDLFRIPALSLAEVDRLVEIEGWDHLEAALAPAKGAIIVSVHLGNVDLVAQVACARGLKVTIPVEPLRPRALLDFVTRLRTAHGLRLVPIDEGALGEVRAALRRGEIVGFALDRDVQGSGELVPLFGRPARLSTAPVLLALRTGAPLLPARSERLDNGRYRVELSPPIFPERGRRGELMATLVRGAEAAIRQRPGQWVMFQRL